MRLKSSLSDNLAEREVPPLPADKVAQAAVAQLALKIMASLWLTYHLAGLVIAPASVPPSSPLIQGSWNLVGQYLHFVNMNHGNQFFAPDPGASTIVRFIAERPDGSTVSGQIPDRATSPRLLYHRHFMLTETLGASDGQDPQMKALLVRAFARELCHRHQASAVTLVRVVHLLPTLEWRRAKYPIDAPELFQEEPLGRFEATDFAELRGDS